MFTLLPENKKKSLIREYHFRMVSIIFLLLTMIFFVGTLSLIPSFVFLKSDFDQKMKERDLLSKTIEEKADSSLQETLENIKQSIGALSSEDLFFSKLLFSIVSNKNVGIKIFSLSNEQVAQNKILIRGIADNRNSLLTFSKILEATEEFENINIPVSNYAKDNNLPFTIEATFALVNKNEDTNKKEKEEERTKENE